MQKIDIYIDILSLTVFSQAHWIQHAQYIVNSLYI